MDALVVRCAETDFAQPGISGLARRFANGRPALACADGALVPSAHEKLASGALLDGNLAGAVYIFDKPGRIVVETGAPRGFKPENMTVFLGNPDSIEALLFKNAVAKQFRASFVSKAFPDYEGDLLEWIRSEKRTLTHAESPTME
jgi:hypothetical protein